MTAMMIPAIDQHVAKAGGAHLEGDFLRVVGGHVSSRTRPCLASFVGWPIEPAGTTPVASRRVGGGASCPRVARGALGHPIRWTVTPEGRLVFTDLSTGSLGACWLTATVAL